MHTPVRQPVLCCALLEHGLLDLFLPWCRLSEDGLLLGYVDVESGYTTLSGLLWHLQRSTRESADTEPAF